MTSYRSYPYPTSSSSSSSSSSSPSSSSFPYELLTPRSSTESRVSEALPLDFTKPLELQSHIKLEPMSQTPLHGTSPSLEIQVASSPSRQREDKVETVKVSLKRLRPGDAQEHYGIGTEEFNKLRELLSDARLRFDFDSDLKTLIVRMNSSTHEAATSEAFGWIQRSMKCQEKLVSDCGLDGELDWRLGANLPSKLEGGTSEGVVSSESGFVADATVQNSDNDCLSMLEVGFWQTRQKALDKINKRLANNPKLVGAVVISIDESHVFSKPKRRSTKADALVMPLWRNTVKRAPKLGPIEYRGFRWIGSITCSLDIRLRGEAQPRAQQISIIPSSDAGDLEASTALTDLWELLVRDVAGEGVDPVPFVVDWNEFRRELIKSVGSTALGRHLDWNGHRRVRDDNLEAELAARQGTIV